MRVIQRITIVKRAKPLNKGINDELQWFGSSLGLFNLRDKDKSCFRIFIEILKSTRKGKSLSSDDIAAKLKLSRGTVVHHLNKLIEAGIVIRERNRYSLRIGSLSSLVGEMEKDFMRASEDIREVAERIDKELRF